MKTKTFKPPRSLTRIFPQVKQVVHAKTAVKVEVSPKDCTEGKSYQTSECALAKAARRQFKADGVAIRLTDSFVVQGDTATRFKTPESVKRELVSFDRHKDFASGTYYLSPAPPIWANPNKKPSSGHNKGDRRSTPRIVHRTIRVRTTNSQQA